MPVPITRILIIVIACYGLIIIADLIFNRSRDALIRCLIESALLVAVVAILNVTTGFPAAKQAFGGVPPIWAFAVMIASTVLGMAAQYAFYQNKKFSWGSFLRPLVISPLILLPLMGTMQGIQSFETIQLISFGMLSFQNGFFWKEVFEKVRKDITPQNENNPKPDENKK